MDTLADGEYYCLDAQDIYYTPAQQGFNYTFTLEITSCEATGLLWYRRTQTPFPYDYFNVTECGDPLNASVEPTATVKVISQVFDYNAYLKGVEYPYLY